MSLNLFIRAPVSAGVKKSLKHQLQDYRLCHKLLNFSSCFCTKTAPNNTQGEEKHEQIARNESPTPKFRRKLLNGPNLKDFFRDENLKNQENLQEEHVVPYLQDINRYGQKRKVYFDVYGCQMNVNDTEIIWSILQKHNYLKTSNLLEADVVLIVTCAIREGAESKIWGRLEYLRGINKSKATFSSRFKVGVLGCMAERLKHKVLEKNKTVDLVAGPDAYRDLPRLLALTENDQKSVNVLLSFDETYADIMPVRLNENSVSAFVSIMRGCDNMCTYCIVPFTRGKERSRPVDSILREIELLSQQGVKEVTLLGQNVNSYRDLSNSGDIFINNQTNLAKGFKTVYKSKIGGRRFAHLLEKVADVNPEMRIRFTSPHPKDFPDEVLHVIKSRPNICKNLHMPAQSGNTNVLERMRRGYTREAYIELVDHIRYLLPEVSLSSDFICGFCGETEEEFEDTISLMEMVQYNNAYLFPYSMREKTAAHRRYTDDVPAEVKQKRLERMIQTFRFYAEKLNRAQIGRLQLILIEGFSRRSRNQLAGRNDQNIKVVIPAGEVPQKDGRSSKELGPGDYVVVQINAANSQILKGIPLYHTTLSEHFLEYPDCFENSCYSMM
ncbi:CDK5RAP1-like protein [Tribolium castaneum]|uniref:CDK5RAP1-like protein n=1 Tax=Tribolium castaneum TaxID=7070 RepID=D6WVN1_TRICA|nr:PREDICTED: CDK5RAP1-like protein [Tribolium castaneum]EFA08272.1 CDK5RAP1-like protein [Tribolium castaneum]|eukprot:XP_973511.1 PREDICTED: CDK5RAP1-like protein [Tribolium castaneum]